MVVGLLVFSAASAYAQSTAIVNYHSEEAFAVPAGDSTATAMVRNVIFYHNGALVTCDSAVLYNKHYIECYKNVIINRDSTYVYGDRVDFNGITNIARVYAPIIKTLDGDMTMYSYDMEFNTLTNIGRYTMGGTISQKDNLMESRQAIYHADERQVYFVGDVEMRNEEYILRTDSMGYNFDTEVTDFYRPATIWNSDGDFLSADLGSYDRVSDTYHFTKNSYILMSDDREIFADSMTYIKSAGIIYMSGNIQVYDPEQRSYLFGDYGVYFEESQEAILTENPSTINIEEGEQPDSTYLRGDSLFMYTLRWEEEFTTELATRLRLPRREELDSVRLGLRELYPVERPDTLVADSLSNWAHLYGPGADSTLLQYGMLGVAPDSLPPDSLRMEAPPLLDSLARSEMRPDSLMNAADSLVLPSDLPMNVLPDPPVTEPDVLLPDSLSIRGDSIVVEPEEPVKTRRQLRRERRLERRREKMREYVVEQGILLPDTAAVEMDSLPPVPDTLMTIPADTVPRDSLQRVLRANRHVKMFRSDLQMICDSLVAFSADSTTHLYRHPVLWNEDNQITANEMHFFSRDEQLERADFEGNPIMASWVLDSLFNQVTGDRIEARFRNNEIREMWVFQNTKNYYYMQQEDKPDDVGGFMDITSRDMVFRFDSTRVRQIVWYGDQKTTTYPMSKIPAEHPQRFPGFEWLPHLRPASPQDVCDRTIRPSQQEQSRAIPYPSFRITTGMETNKKLYIRDGVWRDRDETIRIDPAYFLNLP